MCLTGHNLGLFNIYKTIASLSYNSMRHTECRGLTNWHASYAAMLSKIEELFPHYLFPLKDRPIGKA